MIEQEDNFDSFSSFKYNLYFEVLVRCHIYFYNPNHNNYVKSLNHAEQIENHIKNSLSNADTKDKILACDDISREFMRINIHIYNEELRKIDQEQVSVYQKLIPTEINQMDADSEEYLNRISILSACYWLSKKYCYIRSNLLSTQTDKIGSKEEK